MGECLFCEIAAGKVPADILYENDELLAFSDVNPQAPVHFLVIPKAHITTINETDDTKLIGRLVLIARNLARHKGFAEDGYRLVINCNENGGQTIYHIHLHLLAGRMLHWPPG